MNPADLVADAAWLPHRIVDGGRAIRFIRADRQAQARATFLDDESLGTTAPRIDMETAALARLPTPAPAPIHFIFHSAFARSTMLARAMDLPGLAMGLKEPIILNDAAQLARAGRLPTPLLELVLRLLARPWGAGESVVLKPSNAANRIMRELMTLRPDARAILLYRSLPAFLRSVGRKGMFGRIWARRHLAMIRVEAPGGAALPADDLLVQTDLQAAAYGWLIQHAQFAALAAAMPARVALVEADELVGDAPAALTAVTRWFGIPLTPERTAETVAGPAYAENAKRIGERFGGEHDRDPAPIDAAEIEMVAEWIRAVAAHARVPLTFGPRLIPTA